MHLDLWQVENYKRTKVLSCLPPVLMIIVSESRFVGTAYYSGLHRFMDDPTRTGVKLLLQYIVSVEAASL